MKRRSIFSFFLTAIVLLAGGAAAFATGEEAKSGSIADALSREVQAVYEKSHASVVRIEAHDKNGKLVGTGFFIDPNGTILTSYSIGGESFNLVALTGELKHPLRRLTADPRSGIALLQMEKASSPTPFLKMGSSRELKVASPVVLVAYTLDLPLAPHFGMIAGFDHKHDNRYFATTHIRANVPVKRGQGGAPLLNMRGEAMGVIISGIDNGSSCYALPIEAAGKIHRDYVRFGAARPGRLGLKIEHAEAAALNGSTAQVRRVDQHGPASAAGIVKGDIITRIGQCQIQSPDDLLNACFYLTAGDVVEVVLNRNGEEMTTRISPVDPPALGSKRKRAKAGGGGDLFDITLRP